MRFEGRELKSYAEPVTVGELEIGSVYFALQYIDDELLIPILEPLVFIGRNLLPDDQGIVYFQDAGSYRDGIRFESANPDDSDVYAQAETEIKHIFTYERALDGLLVCSIRRQKRQLS